MDLLDEILSDPVVTSRTGSKFQPRTKACPRKQTLAPKLSTLTHDEKTTTPVTNSTDPPSKNDEGCSSDGCRDTTQIKSSSPLPVIQETKESEYDFYVDAMQSDSNCYSHPTSTEMQKDPIQFDLDSCGSILHLHSSTDGVSTVHEAVVLNQNGLEATQRVDGHFFGGKILEENVDMFSGLDCLHDFHTQPRNDTDSSRLKPAAISNEDEDMSNQSLEVELQEGADIVMDSVSTETAPQSGQPACKYQPKSKMKIVKENTNTKIPQREISDMPPLSSQVTSCDTRCMHETSFAANPTDSINLDGYASVNPYSEASINVGSMACDSYDDILFDGYNSEDPDVELRGVQEMSPEVDPEYEHSKSTANLRQQHQVVDEHEPGVNGNSSFCYEHSDDCYLDGDGYIDSETSKGASSQGKKASSAKATQPSNENEKSTRKRKGAGETISTAQVEKRPKKFSHSTRRSKRQVNKVLLETHEDDIDFQKISLRDLIIYHEYKEKQAKKEATTSRQVEANQRTHTVGKQNYNGEEGSLASEQGRGTDDDEAADVVDLTSAYFNYQSFMDKTPRAKWSKQDTQLFYEGVRQFGTDFCLIQQLFPGRTRHQIKLKFKNEERRNPLQLSDALTHRAKDHSHFLSVIGQLQEAASKEKNESNENELTENAEELEELSINKNSGEEPNHGLEEKTDINDKEEHADSSAAAADVHKPLKSDDDDNDDDDDPCKWDDYTFDF